jgi:hypothetical protein
MKFKYAGEFRKNIAATMIQKRFRKFISYLARMLHYKKIAAANFFLNKWREHQK